MTATRRRRPAPVPKSGEPVEGGYRCVECGHGTKLWAYAGANVYGPLAANGSELAEHEAVEEWGIHEDSIQCTEHPGAVIEMFNRGQWCRWWSCPRCRGRGRVGVGEHWKAPDGYECSAKTPWGDRYKHEGWLPAAETAPPTSARPCLTPVEDTRLR